MSTNRAQQVISTRWLPSLLLLLLAAVHCSTPTGEGDGGDAGTPDAETQPDADHPSDVGPDSSDGDIPDGLDPLAVTATQPSHGSFTGGTEVLVRGRGFVDGVEVFFGSRQVDPADLQLVDDNRISVLTPPGDPGLVEVQVTVPGGDEARLAEGFTYDAWYVDPLTGSAAGGTAVRLIGGQDVFSLDSAVSFDGIPAADVVVVSSSEITCRTPPGAVGPADVAVQSATGGDQVLGGAFTYYDSTDPVNGGLGGGPIQGIVDVTILDAATRGPLPDSFVILGADGSTPYQGVTDANGQITFSGDDLTGPQTVSASHGPVMVYDDDDEPIGEMTFESASIVAFDARSVTMFLTPIPPPQPGVPPTGRRGGYIEGELLFEHDSEFGPYDWDIVPEPIPPYERKVALVYTTQSSTASSLPSPGADGTVYDTEEYRGEYGYIFRIYSRAAAVAVYAMGGIINDETGEFRPYVMGVTRGIVVGADETVTNVQIYMTRQLSTTLEVDLVDPPAPDDTGTPNTYIIETFLDLGAEGVISRPETEVRTAAGHRPHTFSGWTDLSGNLSDASYTVVAGAWTIRAGTDEEANPWSVVIRAGLGNDDIAEPILIDEFLGIPRPVNPQQGAAVVDGLMEWEALSASTPTFSYVTLTVPGGLVPIPYWSIVLRGGVTSYELPDMTALAEMPEPPQGSVIWQVWSFTVPDLDFDSWTYRYLRSQYWTAYAVDSWYVTLDRR